MTDYERTEYDSRKLKRWEQIALADPPRGWGFYLAGILIIGAALGAALGVAAGM